ncbi:hypothetical protein D3C77_631170 [compost metagenome]
MRAQRIVYRRLDRRHRSEMHHRTTPLQRLANAGGICHVADDQLQPGVIRQIAALSSRQIIQHPHRITAREQGIDQIGTDETGPAGNQDRTFSHDGNSAPAAAPSRHATRAA